MIELSRNTLRMLVGFVTVHCYLGGHKTSIGLKQKSDCGLCGAEDENPCQLFRQTCH